MLLLYLLLLCSTVCVQSQTTCTAGSTLQSPGQMSSNKKLFANLNPNDRASCAGTVVAWHYCCYTDVSSDETYQFETAMYRGESNVDLDLVAGSVRTFTWHGSALQDAANGGNFFCTTHTLAESDYFEVLEQDIVTACIRDRGNNKAMPIISEGIPTSDLDTAGEESCGSQHLGSNDLDNQESDAILHLYAEIMPPPPLSTLPPTTPPPTTPPPTMPMSVQTEPPTSTTDAQQPTSSTTSKVTTGSEAGEATQSSTNPQYSSTTEGMGDKVTTEGMGSTLSSEQGSIVAQTTEPADRAGSSIPVSTVSAVVVVLVLALIFAPVVTLVLVLFYRRCKQQHRGKKLHSVQSETTGIVNAVYGLSRSHDNQYATIAVADQVLMSEVPMYDIPVFPLGSFEKPPPATQSTLSSDNTVPIYEYADFGPDLGLNQKEDIYANLSPYCIPATEEDELYEQLRTFGIRSIHKRDIVVMSHLGSGQFGSVDQGVWRRPNDSAVDVALKTLKKSASKQDKVRFLQEGAIMAQFKHPNVISLHGVVSGEPLLLVFELMNKGDLRQLLISTQSDTEQISKPEFAHLLLVFSRQVALGMQYLTGKKFVHRDLAARNILVSSDNVCKVADFGMSRDLADEQYYVAQGGKIPVKWTAPEALHFKKYSTASDVWSYSCLLYEIWSLGHKPFEDKRIPEVLRLIDSGYRLPPPPGCPRRVYELMIAAWHPDSSSRPGFRDVLLALMMNDEEVLCVPSGHEEGSQARVLGAPLKKGEALYPELQRKYC